MKRIITFSLLIAVLLSCLCIVSFADNTEQTPCLVDGAGLLSDSEYQKVYNKLVSVGDKHNIDVVVLTVLGLEGKTAEAYADDFYDYCGYGRGSARNGCLLLVDMQSRQWHISTTGSCIKSITDKGIDYISDGFLSDLKNGNYSSAFMSFANDVDYVVGCAENNTSVRSPFRLTYLLIGLAIGLIIATVTIIALYSQLKSVRSKAQADDYLVDGSFALTQENDIFRGTFVTKTRRPKNNSGSSSTHVGSSGTSHGGGGGSF